MEANEQADERILNALAAAADPILDTPPGDRADGYREGRRGHRTAPSCGLAGSSWRRLHLEIDLSTRFLRLDWAMIHVWASCATPGTPLVIHPGRAQDALLHLAINVSGRYLEDHTIELRAPRAGAGRPRDEPANRASAAKLT